MNSQYPLSSTCQEIRHRVGSIVVCLAVSLVLFGCASTTITDREQLVFGELPRPGNILVYDFAASADELPANSTLYGSPELGPLLKKIFTNMSVGGEISPDGSNSIKIQLGSEC